MKRVVMFLALAPISIPMVADAASIRQKTSHFTVTGSTLDELDESLGRSGPLPSGGDVGHPGATSVSFDGKVTYKPTPKGCAIDRADFSLDIEVILPRWRKPAAASDETVLLWETLERDVVRHEKKHADIARNWVQRLEMAVRNLAPRRSCDALEKAVSATNRRYLEGHEAEQRAFDRQESREMGLRLNRQLRDRLRAEQAD